MKYKLILILIILTGFFLRIIGIHNHSGLTYDELFSLNMANTDPLNLFFDKLINKDYHPPLYYLTLKLWVKLFGCADAVLQMLSVIFSTLSIWIAYLIGKAYKSKNCGLWLASFFAFSFCYIYKAQDVRFYQMALLESLLIVLFSYKFLNNKYKIKYLIYLITSELFLLYTLTLGVIFVAINTLILSYFVYKNSKNIKKFVYAHLFFVIFYTPQLIITLMQVLNAKNTLLENPWDWIVNSNILLCMFKFLDFTYIPLKNLIENTTISTILFVLFLITVTYLNVKSKNSIRIYTYLLFSGLILVFMTASWFELLKISCNLNYFYILVAICTILSVITFCNKKIIAIVLLILQFSYLIYAIRTPVYIYKNNQSRFRYPSEYIEAYSKNKKLIYAPYGEKFLSKYISNFEILNIDGDELFTMPNYSNAVKLVLDDDIEALTIEKKNEYLKNYFSQNLPSNALKATYNNAINKLNKNELFVLMVHKNRFFTEKHFNNLINYYPDFPKSSLTIGKITLDILNLSNNDERLEFEYSKFIDNEWHITIYRKI